MSFDRLAPHYRWMEFVLAGSLLQRCRLAWIDEAVSARNVLVAGEGNGRFVSACVERLPQARFTVVDASARMLDQAARRWKHAGGEPDRLLCVHAALPGWTPPAAEFDLIATHFFLDCFPVGSLPRVVGALAGGATKDARWLLSDFEVPERGAAQWRARMVLALAYTFFRLATRLPASELVPPETALGANGFSRLRRRTFNAGLLKAECWRREPSLSRVGPAEAF